MKIKLKFCLLFLLIDISFGNTGIAQKFCIITDAGYSYRLMIKPDSITDNNNISYFEKKKPGFNYNIEVAWFKDNYGFGIRFNSFMNSVSGKYAVLSDTFNKSEITRFNYYSIQYHSRKEFGKTRFWRELSVGFGLLTYNNDEKVDTTKINFTGYTYGLNLAFSIEYRLSKHLYLSIAPNILIAKINQLEQNGYPVQLKNGESLARADITGGIKVFF